jgi:hypothetical protein
MGVCLKGHMKLKSFKSTINWKKPFCWPVFAIALLVFLPACSSGPAPKKLETEGLTLMYRDKSSLSSEVNKMRFNHPVQLSQAEVHNHLLSLRYEELSLLGKKKYVFSSKGLEEVSRILTKALNRVKPDKFVYFVMETAAGATEVDVFGTDNKLNWRVNSVRGLKFSNSSFSNFGGAHWRLVPREGQSYHVTQKLIGTSTRDNWIIADLKLTRIARGQVKKQPARSTETRMPSSPTRNSAPAANQENLEKKLQFLKDLRDKELIDESEYERKRKELIDTYL